MKTEPDQCTARLLAQIKCAFAGTINLEGVQTLADLTPEALRRQHAAAIANVREQKFGVFADLAGARNPSRLPTVAEIKRSIA